MSISSQFLAQLSSELGTQVVAQDIYILAAMLVIYVIASRILSEVTYSVKSLVNPMVKHMNDKRWAKEKALRIKMEIAARNEREPMVR